MYHTFTLLFTKAAIDTTRIPKNQWYVKADTYWIFAFDIFVIEWEKLEKQFKRYTTLSDAFAARQQFSVNAQPIFDLIEAVELESFLMQHLFIDHPDDFYNLIVKDKQIHKRRDWDAIEDILEYFTSIQDSPDERKFYRSICDHFDRTFK